MNFLSTYVLNYKYITTPSLDKLIAALTYIN